MTSRGMYGVVSCPQDEELSMQNLRACRSRAARSPWCSGRSHGPAPLLEARPSGADRRAAGAVQRAHIGARLDRRRPRSDPVRLLAPKDDVLIGHGLRSPAGSESVPEAAVEALEGGRVGCSWDWRSRACSLLACLSKIRRCLSGMRLICMTSRSAYAASDMWPLLISQTMSCGPPHHCPLRQ